MEVSTVVVMRGMRTARIRGKGRISQISKCLVRFVDSLQMHFDARDALFVVLHHLGGDQVRAERGLDRCQATMNAISPRNGGQQHCDGDTDQASKDGDGGFE